MDWDILNNKGKRVKVATLSEEIFGVELNEGVLHAVVKAYRANRRQGTHATKTKAMVSGGGKKPFRQKGTGNARQGSSRSPLMPGGGTAHGPQPRDYTEFTNKKVKVLALKIALSEKVRHKKFLIVDDFGIESFKTKAVLSVMQALQTPGKALLLDSRQDDFLFRSTRNIKGLSTVSPQELNAEDVLTYETLILTERALSALENRLIGRAG